MELRNIIITLFKIARYIIYRRDPHYKKVGKRDECEDGCRMLKEGDECTNGL